MMRALNNPDALRTAKMQAALIVKRRCQHEADRWQEWADKAATVYNKEKL